MAEQVIEEFEAAYKHLKKEAASLVKEARSQDCRYEDGRLKDEFMARYFVMKSQQYVEYERLMSELRSSQEEKARAYLEDEVTYSITPTISALMGKLNFVVYGDVPAIANARTGRIGRASNAESATDFYTIGTTASLLRQPRDTRRRRQQPRQTFAE